MANIGEDTGIPKVQPSGEGYRVRMTPEDAGAGIGTSLQKLGQGIEKSTDFYGQVAADDANNNWEKKAQQILYGDPNDPDKPGYFALKGSDAMRERPNVIRALQAAEDEQRNTLFTPQSKLQFNQATRHSRNFYEQQIGSHYDQQYNAWGVNTSTDKLAMAEDNVARDPMNPQVIGMSLASARSAAIRMEQLKNGSGADVTAAVTQADQRVRLKQLDAMRVKDPAAALDLLTKDPGGEVLRSLPNYASLVHSVQEDAYNATRAKQTDTDIASWRARAAQEVNPGPGAMPGGTEPLVSKVDAAYQPATRAILAGETVTDPRSAGPKGDYRVAGLGQFTVDQWKHTTGYEIKPGDVGVLGRDPRLNADQSVAAIGKLAQENRDVYFKEFHREPTPGDLAVMHQQGTTGGMKLFRALVATPNAPATNFISANKLTQNKIPADATVAQAVRGISNYYTGKLLQKPDFDITKAPGMTTAGNIDPWNRPVLHNGDGTYSTTSSMSIGTDKGEVLIPTVVDGKRLTEAEAKAHYEKTGEHLGIFKTPEDADKYATALHNAQASMYDEHGNPVAPQQSADRQYLSVSDYMLDHLEEAVDNYRTKIAADPALAGRDDLIQRATNDFEVQYRRQIRDQNQQYVVDAHQLQAAIGQGHMTSEGQLMASSPQNAATWLRLQYENPPAAESMRNWFKANAGGAAKTYGTQFTPMLQRVMAPVGDPNRVTDPSQIDAMITAGENSTLTNSGAAVLHQVLTERHTPEGENNNAALSSFLNTAHTMISPMTKPALGQYWPQGEQKYQRFVGQALTMIAQERAQGTPLPEILKKGGPVDTLLGQAVPTLADQRKAAAEVVHDPRAKPAVAAYNYLKQSKSPKDLQAGIDKGIITPEQARQASIMNATTVKELQDAYRAKLISRKDAAMALDHLSKYGRNFYGKPAT